MVRKLCSLLVAVILLAAFGGSVMAETLRGTISKADRREITVKTKDGKETTLKVSGSRTQIEGGDRESLKEGMRVTVEHSGGEAQKITVSKKK